MAQRTSHNEGGRAGRKAARKPLNEASVEVSKSISQMALSQLALGAWNIRGLFTNDSGLKRLDDDTASQDCSKMSQLIFHAIQHGIGLLCISETHGRSARSDICVEDKFGDTWRILESGNPQGGTKGVGFLVSPSFHVEEFVAMGPRMALIKVTNKNLPLQKPDEAPASTVLSVYAPTESAGTPAQLDAFYSDLDNVLTTSRQKGVSPIIAGDFNVNIGQDKEEGSKVTGRLVVGVTPSRNSERVFDLCRRHDYVIANTYLGSKHEDLLTWYHPRTGAGHTKDLILVPRRMLMFLKSVRADQGASVGNNDHSLVVMNLKHRMRIRRLHLKALGTILLSRRRVRPGHGYDAHVRKPKFRARLPDDHILYQEALSTRLENAEPGWEGTYQAIKSSLAAAMPRDRPRVTRARRWQDFAGSRLHKAIEAAALSRRRYLAEGRSLQLKAIMLSDKRMVKAVVKAAKEKFSEYCTKLYLDGSRREKSKARKLLEGGSSGRSAEIHPDVMAAHFNNLFSRVSDRNTLDLDSYSHLLPPKADTHWEIGGAPSPAEVRGAIKGLSSGKAAGQDGLTAEVFKAAGEQLVSRLALDFERIWPVEGQPNAGQVDMRCEVFQSWQDAEVVCLFKGKGSPTDPGQYRGIFLLDVAGKILAAIIAERIGSLIEGWLSDSQCGFRKRRGTNHQIHSLRRLQTEVRRASLPTAVVFVDFEKAFDSPPRQALLECLRWIGCPPDVVEVIRAIHHDPRGKIQGNDSWFKVARGIRQGCVLGPILFNLLLDFCLHLAEVRRHGVELECEDKRELKCPDDIRGTSFRMSDVNYADDIGLVGTDLGELSAALQRLQSITGRIGLNVSKKKTEWMWLMPPPDDMCHAQPAHAVTDRDGGCCSRVSLDGSPVVHTHQFTYLGALFTEQGGMSGELSIRLNKARNKLNSLGFVWRSNARLRYKKRLFMSEVVPVLLYGAETWTLTGRDYQELECFMNYARLRLCDRRRLVDGIVLPNERLHQMVRLPEVAELIVPRQLTFFAGMVYKPSSLLARKMVYARVKYPIRMVSGTERARYDNCIPATMEFWLDRASGLNHSDKRGHLRAFLCSLGHPADDGTSEGHQSDENPTNPLGLVTPMTDLGSTGSPREALELLGNVMAGQTSRLCRTILKSAWRGAAAGDTGRFPGVLSRAYGAKERKFPCGLCELKYAEHKALLRHMRRAHDEQSGERSSLSARSGRHIARLGMQASTDPAQTNLVYPIITPVPVPHPESGGLNRGCGGFSCPIDGCSRAYKSAGWLKRHLKDAHGSASLLSTETQEAGFLVVGGPVVAPQPSAPVAVGRDGWRPGMECPFPGCEQRGQGGGWKCWKSVQNHMARVHHVNANTGGSSRVRKGKEAPKDGSGP